MPSIGLGSVVNTTAVSSLCVLINSLRIRCCARHGRSLKESGIDPEDGNPDASPIKAGPAATPDAGVPVPRVCGVAGEALGAGECCKLEVKWLGDGVGLSRGSWAVARGSWYCCVAAGVSTNIILGPGASS